MFLVPGGQGEVSLWVEPRPYFLVSGVILSSYGAAAGRAAGSEHQVWPSFPGRAPGWSWSCPLPAWLQGLDLEPNYNENIFKLIPTSF